MFSMGLFLNKNGCLMDFVEAVDCERMLKAFYRRCPPVICVLLKKIMTKLSDEDIWYLKSSCFPAFLVVQFGSHGTYCFCTTLVRSICGHIQEQNVTM